jgi:prepilin-type N-terminal cleavage/methylation domain-containing protein
MPSRPAFTLTELLIVVAIILSLMTMLGSAVSNVRTTQKANATFATITKIDEALMEIFSRYGNEAVSYSSIPGSMSRGQYRSWKIRRDFITRDMPDRWTDVEYVYDNSDFLNSISNPPFPAAGLTAAQRTYLSIWHSVRGRTPSVKEYNASAECLFMILMQSGLTSRSGFEALSTVKVGDQDGDGMQEFWDSWDNPIGYLLWAPALELPPGSDRLFFFPDNIRADPYPGDRMVSPPPALGMRPLIYSPGRDGKSGFERNNEAVTLTMGGSRDDLGRDCGNPQVTPPGNAGGKAEGPDYRVDNVTNFDQEAKP